MTPNRDRSINGGTQKYTRACTHIITHKHVLNGTNGLICYGGMIIIHTCTQARKQTQRHIFVHKHIHTRAQARTQTHKRTYTYTLAHAHTHAHTRTHTHKCKHKPALHIFARAPSRIKNTASSYRGHVPEQQRSHASATTRSRLENADRCFAHKRHSLATQH